VGLSALPFRLAVRGDQLGSLSEQMALLSRTPDGKNDSPRPRYVELQKPSLLQTCTTVLGLTAMIDQSPLPMTLPSTKT